MFGRRLALVLVAAVVSATVLSLTSIGRAASAYPSTVLADQPWGYWKLDESSGSIAADSSGNNHALDVLKRGWSEAPLWGRPGPHGDGTALELRGNPEWTTPGDTVYKEVTNGSEFVDNFTAEAWVYPHVQTMSGNGLLIGAGRAVRSNSSGWALVRRFGDYLAISVNGAEVLQGPALPVNTWSHVAVTRTNGTWKIYKDGVAASGTATQTPITPGDFYFGSDAWGAGNFSFEGLIADGAFYTHALSAEQILAHYQAASRPTQSVTLTASASSVDVGSSVLLSAQVHGVEAPAGTPVRFVLSGANAQEFTVGASTDGSAQFEYWPTKAGQDVVAATTTLGAETISSTSLQVTANGIDCSGVPESERDRWPGFTRSYYLAPLKQMTNQAMVKHYYDLGFDLGQAIRPQGGSASPCPATIALILHFGAQTRLAGGSWGVKPSGFGDKRSNEWVSRLSFAIGKGFYDGTGSYQRAFLRLILGVNDNNGSLKRLTTKVGNDEYYVMDNGQPLTEPPALKRCTTATDNISPVVHAGVTFVVCKKPSAACDASGAPYSEFALMYCGGTAWADAVQWVNLKLGLEGALGQVSAAGGIDAEAGFCSSWHAGWNTSVSSGERNTICGQAARSWVVGFRDSAASKSLLINYGDCSGCKNLEVADEDTNTDANWTWSMGDHFFVASPPSGFTRDFPQIYRSEQASDWLSLAKWGNSHKSRKAIFVGALTELGACTQIERIPGQEDVCDGRRDDPETGWTNLHTKLETVPWLSKQQLWYSSDIYRCEDPMSDCTGDSPSGNRP